MRLTIGLVVAFCAAGCFAGSYIGQHRAIGHLARLELSHPLASSRRLLKSPQWLLAYASSWVGWGFYIAALSLVPLSIVQAISAGAVGVLAFVSSPLSSSTNRTERASALIALSGLLLVLLTVRSGADHRHPSVLLVLCFVGSGLVVGIMVIAVIPLRWRGAALGVVSGLYYGVGDVATKAAVTGEPVLIPVFVSCAALGFIVLQLSYQRASLLGSAGTSALLTNTIPIVAGVVLFGETPPHGAASWLRVVGFAAVIVGAVGIFRQSAPVAHTSEERTPPSATT